MNFRAATVREAQRLRVSGRVWNRDDGAVELIAEGDHATLDALERWLHQGPRAAEVSEVLRTELAGEPRFHDFNLAWSAPREG